LGVTPRKDRVGNGAFFCIPSFLGHQNYRANLEARLKTPAVVAL
jgi:hypothetical protein